MAKALEMKKEIIIDFSKRYGGATVTTADGAYYSETHGIIEEKVFLIYTYIEELKEEDIENLKSLARRVKKEMNQEEIMIEVNHSASFI